MIHVRSSPWLVYPNCANKLSTQLKAPFTSSECKILDVSKPLTFAGNSAFWGAVWGRVRICTHWQGYRSELAPIDLCFRIYALQMSFNNAAMSNLGQGYWECRGMGGTHTRDTGVKDKICRSIPAASFSPIFAPRVAV